MDSTIKQRDLSITEGPAPVGPQKFVSPKALIADMDNLELVQQRAVVDEAEKRLLGKRYQKIKRLGAGKNPGNDKLGYGHRGGADGS